MKDKILQELKARPGKYISGEELSGTLEVSRTAIWKYINQLKEMGYRIESVTRKGYRLMESPDELYSSEIQPLLETDFIGRQIIYLESVDSTNTYAKKMAENGFVDGTVIIADEQVSGRGRLGRHWVSPKGKGIWMTIMLKPHINPADAPKATLVAAGAVCSGIEKACGLNTAIKWPNDIVINGKKLCGILTEMSAEMDEIGYLIVGIGINANLDSEDFSEEVAQIATSVKLENKAAVERKHIVAYVLNEFERLYKLFIQNGDIGSFIEEYKSKSAVLGREIRVIYKKEELRGTAVDISPEGALVVRLADGSLREISSGEVSVRGIYGYI